MKLLSLAVIIGAIQTHHINIGMFSDVHLQLEYDAAGTPFKPTYCQFFELHRDEGILGELNENQLALLGRLGCDSPISLINHIFKLFKKVNAGEHIDFITLTGDITNHGTSVANVESSPEYISKHYKRLKLLHHTVQRLFTRAFPHTPIAYAFGNNDTKFHDQPVLEEDKKEFMEFMYDLWFQQHKPNHKWAHHAEATFKNGGYYKAHIEGNLSVLSFNTLYYNEDYITQARVGNEGEEQWAWLE